MKDTALERLEILPALGMVRGVLFPGARCEAVLATSEGVGAVREAMRSWGNKSIAVFAARARRQGAAEPLDLFEVGTAAEVINLKQQSCCSRWVVELRATGTLRVCEHLQESPFRIARVERLLEPPEDPDLLRCLGAAVRDRVRRIVALTPRCPRRDGTACRISNVTGVSDVVALAMNVLRDLPLEEQQRALELPLVSDRLDFALAELDELLARADPRERRLIQ
jgi:Lon protease-like protein